MRETIPESRSRSPGIPTVLDAGDAFDPAIRGLEEDIGVRLLSRTTRRVAPTEAGEQLLVRLRPALTDVQEALDQLSGLRDKPAGRVRLLIPRVAGTAVIGPKLAQFMRDYPDALLDITADDTRVDIVAGGFDAGIHFGEYIQKDMIAVRVSKDLRAAIVGSPGSVAVNGPLIVDDVELVIGAALDGTKLNNISPKGRSFACWTTGVSHSPDSSSITRAGDNSPPRWRP